MSEIVFCLKVRSAKLFILVFDTVPDVKTSDCKIKIPAEVYSISHHLFHEKNR